MTNSVLYSQGELDSLLQKLRKPQIPEERLSLYIQLHDKYEKVDLSKASAYIDSAYVLSLLIDNDTLKYRTYAAYAINKWQKEELDDALHMIEMALQYQDATTELNIGYLYSTKGLIYYSKDQYSRSIEAHLASNRMFEKYDHLAGLARGYNNLGITYQRLKDWEKARDYHEQSLRICEQLELEHGIAHNLGNLGIVYTNMGDPLKALEVYQRSLTLHQKLEQRSQIFRNYINIASLFTSLGNISKAQMYLDKAFLIAKDDPNPNNKALSLLEQANIHIYSQNYIQAEQDIRSAIEIYQNTNSMQGLKESYFKLSELYEKQGKPEKALNSRKSYEQWHDSVINESYMERIADLEMKYETQQKEFEILKLSKQNQESEQKLLRQKFWNRVLGVVLAGQYIRLRINKKRQEAALQTMMATQETERKRIAQDLHDSVGSILSIAKHKAAGKADLAALIDQSCDELRRISYNLMPAILLKDGLITAVKSLLSQIKRTYGIHTEYYEHIDNYQLDTDTEFTIYRIIQELTQNVIKHAEASQLILHFTLATGKVTIMVEDDGKGFHTNHQNGMGLQNIKTRVSHLKGDFSIDTTPGFGTTVIVNLPV